MNSSRPATLAVQSVLYGNRASEIIAAAEAISRSAGVARQAGSIGAWSYLVGDCSPVPTLSEADVADITSLVEAEGGVAVVTVFGENLGSAAGQNRLAASHDADLLLILNPDAIVAPTTVSRLVEALEPDVGIAEARQIPLEHPKDYDPVTGDTSWVSTACALTSRAVFERIGGFDSQTFFLYGDDVDYSWRVRLDGLRAVYVPGARVFHDKRLTVTGDWPASVAEVRYSAEAALMLAAKYSRPERVARLRTQFRAAGDVERAVVDEFDRRAAAGTLPAPLDPDHSVSQWHADNYAEHRY